MERGLTILLTVLAATAVPSCRSGDQARSTPVFELSSARDLIPEGLAFDAAEKRFFISSVHHGQVVQRSATGVIAPFTMPDAGAILGLEVDRTRGLLWACRHAAGGDLLVAHDLRSGEPTRRVVPPPRAGGHLLNDLEVASDGRVYVTDTVAGEIYELAAASDALVPVAGGFRSPNGIALDSGAKVLFVADDDGISVVDLVARGTTRMQTAPGVDVRGIDGLYWTGHRLIGIQNASLSLKPRVIAIDVRKEPWRAVAVTVLEDRPEMLGIPTTGALVGNQFYFIARSGLDMMDGEGGIRNADALTPATVRRVSFR